MKAEQTLANDSPVWDRGGMEEPLGMPPGSTRAAWKGTHASAYAAPASILVVDDDPTSLHAIEKLLADLGHTIVLAQSGEEALRQALRTDFAVIVLAARVQRADRSTAAKLIRVREPSPQTPIIFLARNRGGLESMFQGCEACVVDYMTKPVIPALLRSKITAFVELYLLNSALRREVQERRRAEMDLRTSKQSLRALAARQESIREDESIRIAREIHDELGQSLTALKMSVAELAERPPAERKALLGTTKRMSEMIDDTMESVRRIAAGLRPQELDELGLFAACEWQVRQLQMRTGIRCRISMSEPPPHIDTGRATAAFRVFQELLTNVVRHAEATELEIRFGISDGALRIVVRDNGRGIAQSEIDAPTALGFLGMRERLLPFGGMLEVMEASMKGTRICVTMPL